MADFYPPQFNPPPDVLGAYIRGQMAPLQVQQAQQQTQMGGLQLDQLRLALNWQRNLQGIASQIYGGATTSQGGAQNQGGTPGIENGPQQTVSANAPSSQPPAYSYNPNDPLAPLLDERRLAGNAVIGSMGAMMHGGDPNKPIADALATRDAAIKDIQERAKLNLSPAADQVDALLTSGSPEQLVLANQNYKQIWDHYASRIGLNPNDPHSLTPGNVRAAATMFFNENVAGRSFGAIAPKPMPVQLKEGAYGSQTDPISGKRETPPVLPEYTYEKKNDLNGGQTFVPLVKKPGFGNNGLVGGAGSAGPDIPGGVQAPTEAEQRSAAFAELTGANLPKMERDEKAGVFLPPRVRTQLLDVAVNDDPSAARNFLSQEFLQTIPQAQRNYIYSALPVLQSAAHQLAGMRGMSQNNVRSLMESMIPLKADADNPEGLSRMYATRRALLAAASAGAGALRNSPDLPNIPRSTSGNGQSQASSAQTPLRTKTINGKTYAEFSPGRWREQ